MQARSILAAVAGILPWILSALWPAFTPAHALLAALALRHGPAQAPASRLLFHDFLTLAVMLWVLHQLRPDASLLTGAAILLAGMLLELLRAQPAGARAARIFLAVVLGLLPSLTFFLRLTEVAPPAALTAADPWRLAAAPAAVSARYEMGATVWFPPARVEPWPLSPAADAGSQGRAILLLAAACAAALWLRLRSSPVALLALLAAGAGPLALQPSSRHVLLQSPAGEPLLMQLDGAFRPGSSQSWDPDREAAPVGLHLSRQELSSAGQAAEIAWLERRPLLAPQEEGVPGALRLLSWYADADGASGPARWSLREDGVLIRRLLPP
jgi:hypothetical protein